MPLFIIMACSDEDYKDKELSEIEYSDTLIEFSFEEP